MDPLKTGRRSSIIPILSLLFTCIFLGLPGIASGQTEITVYDGYTGIVNPYLVNDTARITILLPESPALKSGLRFRDQIIAIDDSVVAGRGIVYRTLNDLLHGKSGTELHLKVKRKGEDSLLEFSMVREPYLHQIAAYEYEYLIDSLEQWDILDILSDSLDTLFTNPLMSKCKVYSVEEGSPAMEIGIREGDLVVSLMEEMDKDYYLHISSSATSSLIVDTSFTILRGDSLIYFDGKPSINGSLKGLKSQISHDFSYPSAWLRVKTVNRITENRTYLLDLPWMSGTDSASFYLVQPSGAIEERRTGVLLPLEERDFVYKDWHAVTLPLEKEAEQTFYIHWKAESQIGTPLMHLIPLETMARHDRTERMVLFSLLGMMMIISIFFLILFFALRNRQYIYFSLYILFFAVFLFASEGYLGEFFWKENVFRSVLISSANPISISMLTICFLLFGISYLELKKSLPAWYWSAVVLLGLVGARVLIILTGSIFGFEIGGVFEDVVLLVWAISVSIIPLFILVLPAIFRIRAGFKPAWYFLLANLVLIPLAIITIVSSSFSFTVHTVHESVLARILEVSGVYVAAVLQILIFSIGISAKMRLAERENKRSQLRIIDQLKENEKLKEKVNRELEQKVRERTKEIREQKEEIESQRDEIEAQRDMVFDQKKEITDSIGYAQRIQAAVLPHTSYMDQVMPEYFVYYKPRDIVSGDFYWIKEVGEFIIIVVADCTGHGVPGAFMSMLGITLLNEQLGKEKLPAPAEILAQLREKVKEMLVQQGESDEQKDGMDMAIAVFNKDKRELHFSGANNPLYIIRKNSQSEQAELEAYASLDHGEYRLFELKGDKQPIGAHWEETPFRTTLVNLKKQDSFYMFSDGYIDQFGGEHRKKFKSMNFKKLLLSVQEERMEVQRQRLEQTFEQWRGPNAQIDDIIVLGVKV